MARRDDQYFDGMFDEARPSSWLEVAGRTADGRLVLTIYEAIPGSERCATGTVALTNEVVITLARRLKDEAPERRAPSIDEIAGGADGDNDG